MKIDLFSIGRFTVHGYGLMIALGVIAAILLASMRAKKNGLSDDVMWDIAIWSIIGGGLGAKLLYIIVNFKGFLKNPKEYIGAEGFVVYGGLILGILFALIYCKIKKAVFIDYLDIAVASISVGQCFGRIGCFLAGCCYGKETTSCIGVTFPESSLAPLGVKVIPTQLISSFGNLLIAVALIIFYKKCKKQGFTSAMYLILYGIGRFLIEFLRDDNRGGFGPFSTSQWISFLFVAAGIIVMVIFKNKPERANDLAEKVESEDVKKAEEEEKSESEDAEKVEEAETEDEKMSESDNDDESEKTDSEDKTEE